MCAIICAIITGLISVKELMTIRPTNRVNELFVIIITFLK